ncbi:hypothetical protein [Erwinia sp. JUb26]|uniref:hypothetical protein n=1 Tax=Erwinia sp. JUb26 TaxID=2485126 RepID=UPI000F951D12|nr:hypothetical protein [Erwinia sp. JUb26]ROR14637.1 FidL-like putative membrane protein [Erwinia sp. JUb26]
MKSHAKFQRKLLYILSTAVVVAIIGLGYVLFYPAKKEGFDCSGYLIVDSDAFNFTAGLNSYLLMGDDDKGYFNVSGMVTSNTVTYHVERSYGFSYQRQKDGIYHLTDITMSRRKADSAGDDMMSKVLISPDPDHGRYIKIKELGNAYVLQGVYSPTLMCVQS